MPALKKQKSTCFSATKPTARSFLGQIRKVTGLFAPKMRTAAARLGVYDLSGRKVADGTDTNGLPQGLYIVGGRKVFVR